MISEDSQKYLINIARNSVLFMLNNSSEPTIRDLGIPTDPLMGERRGVFVTIKQGGKLRGCIGSVVANRTLVEQVIYQSINAAFRDERFSPITLEDIETISFEISILTPAEDVKYLKDIKLYKHGIIIEKNNKRALFLPKVARENNWDMKTTLTRLCDKAGLNHDDWKSGAKFEVFESFDFKE